MRSVRESIVVSMCLGLTLVLACGVSPACGEEFLKTTAVYKTVGDLQIRADVYRPDGHEVLPVVVWIHGGALIMGHRDGISGRVRNYAKSRGVALVSIDYRPAPESKLPVIIEDVEDAFRWIRGPAAERFHLDANRIAVTGGSAEFSKHGIDHRLISIEKGEHGLGGGDSQRIEQAYQDAEEFLDRFLLAK